MMIPIASGATTSAGGGPGEATATLDAEFDPAALGGSEFAAWLMLAAGTALPPSTGAGDTSAEASPVSEAQSAVALSALAGGTALPPGGTALPLGGAPRVQAEGVALSYQGQERQPSSPGIVVTDDGGVEGEVISVLRTSSAVVEAAVVPASVHALLRAGAAGVASMRNSTPAVPELGDLAGGAEPLIGAGSTVRGATLPSVEAAGAAGGAPPQPISGEMLSQHLVRMVRNGSRDVRLHVHPAELGAIDIQLKLDGDAARLTFTCGHPQVRDALENALPRLRDLLGDAGLNLSQADVETQGRDGRPQQSNREAPGLLGSPAAEEPVGMDAKPMRPLVRIGLIDTFV